MRLLKTIQKYGNYKIFSHKKSTFQTWPINSSHLTGPSPTTTTSITASSALTNASDIYRGPFHLHSPALGTRVQQLWLLAEILTDNDDGKSGLTPVEREYEMLLALYGVL